MSAITIELDNSLTPTLIGDTSIDAEGESLPVRVRVKDELKQVTGVTFDYEQKLVILSIEE